MSILDNEGHDPNGLGNRPSWGEVRRLNAEIERLRAALKPFAEAADDAEGYSDDHAIGCEPAMELSIHIEAGALAPLKVSHLRATKRALGESEQTPDEDK